MTRFNADLSDAQATAGCTAWNDCLRGHAVYPLTRTQYTHARETRNDYLHALMNHRNTEEF